jgi:hypothetical protein
MSINAMSINAMSINAMSINAMSINSGGMLSGRWDPDFRRALNDEETQEFMRYLVGCALPEGRSITFYNWPTDGSSVQTFEMHGALGYAPEWEDGSCNTNCQRWLTACMLAHTNHKGVKMRISLRREGSYGDPLSDKEVQAFTARDGAFYGNLFQEGSDPLMSGPALYAARGDFTKLENFDERFCDADDPDCPVSIPGPWTNTSCTYNTGQACTQYGNAPYLVAGTCATIDMCNENKLVNLYRKNYGQVLSVYRPFNDCDGSTTSVDLDYTHQVGGSGARIHRPECSACAWHVVNALGDSYCKNNRWDATCAREAIDYCALDASGAATVHSLCETGDPLTMGDSECIDMICRDDPYCCQADGTWDKSCVQKVTMTCGYDCNDSNVHDVGVWSACSGSKPCAPGGGGDCDGDGQCMAGSTCVNNVGANYGWASGVDVCESCREFGIAGNFGWDFCSPDCPCTHGEGDCDSNADCRDGTVCKQNVGARYGKSSSLDVCERP